MRKIGLYLNTIKYLRVKQVLTRFIKRKGNIPKWNAELSLQMPTLFIDGLDDATEYLKRFDCEELLQNKITLLHETHTIDWNHWKIDGEPRHLWLFNLQYMEYLIPLALKYQETLNKKYYQLIKTVLLTWIDNFQEKSGDAWQSYTISLRIPNIMIACNLLKQTDAPVESLIKDITPSIIEQYYFLASHTEKHLLGNHYFENIKCLLICSIALGQKEKAHKYVKQLLAECREQILADGMHYERSFMYHKIVLEDLMRVVQAIHSTDYLDEECNLFKQYIGRMVRVESVFEQGLHRTLLFNDAGNNVAKPTAPLIQAGTRIDETLCEADAPMQLADAGYYQYKLLSERVKIIIDCGTIGPDYIPGHAHCDCLSYELFLDGQPVLVNAGTYQYQDALRSYYRSTKAHNTLILDGVEQSQCWGEHRVAKRITKVTAVAQERKFAGTFTDQKGNQLRREFHLEEGCIRVTDSQIHSPHGKISSWIHLPPNSRVDWNAEQKAYQISNLNWNMDVLIYVKDNETCKLMEYPYAPDFGKKTDSTAIEMQGEQIEYKIKFTEKNNG